MNEKKYEANYQVLKAVSLDELAEKLTNLSSESWSIVIVKTTKVQDIYECLVKRVQELTKVNDLASTNPEPTRTHTKSAQNNPNNNQADTPKEKQ